MKYFKFTPFLYLAVAIFCIYDGFVKMNRNEENYMLSFVIAAVALSMFFFRLWFFRRMEKRRKDMENKR